MTPQYRSSQPAHWVVPRAHTDASQRLHAYGPIVPMQRRYSLRTWLRTWGRALGIAVLCAGLVVAVVLANLAAGV